MLHLPLRARGVVVALLLGLVLALGSTVPALAQGNSASVGVANAYGMSAMGYSAGSMSDDGQGGGGAMGRGSALRFVVLNQRAHVRFVAIYSFAFHPATMRVQRGTTVVWTNDGHMPHTVTFNNGMADSGIIYPGQSVWFTFTRSGTFAYHCRIHPFMHGKVTVTP